MRSDLCRMAYEIHSRMKGFKAPEIWEFLEKSQWWPHEKLSAFQDEKLQFLIKYVYRHVPYYRSLMAEKRLHPDDIKTTSDLVKFPILTKETLRSRRDEFISDEASSFKPSIRNTGGSTGIPLKIMNDQTNSAWENAAFRRGMGFSGYKFGDSIVNLFGGTLGLAPTGLKQRLKKSFLGEVSLPAFEIGEKTLPDYIEKIKRKKARFLHGYTSAIYLLAELIISAKIDIHMKAVFPTAETLYDFQRENIEKAFNCKVFNQYGCGECNSIAIECMEHNGLHITDEHVFLEALESDERLQDEKMGALTLTTLNNFAMPLIRYQNGDAISLEEKPCPCGRGLSRIQKIYGRANDLLLTNDGRLISATLLPSFCVNVHMKRVQQIQVIQSEKGAIRLKVVAEDSRATPDLEPLYKVLHRYLGPVDIKVEYVNAIPRTPQGKFKYVVSDFGYELLHK